MTLQVPIGIDDFRLVREEGMAYVDKSALIRELVDTVGVQVSSFPRPRRFGKSLNLSMLRCWFELVERPPHFFCAPSLSPPTDATPAHYRPTQPPSGEVFLPVRTG